MSDGRETRRQLGDEQRDNRPTGEPEPGARSTTERAALTEEELLGQGSEVVPERAALSTVAGGWMGMSVAGDVAAEPSPVDDVVTIQPVHEPQGDATEAGDL